MLLLKNGKDFTEKMIFSGRENHAKAWEYRKYIVADFQRRKVVEGEIGDVNQA